LNSLERGMESSDSPKRGIWS